MQRLQADRKSDTVYESAPIVVIGNGPVGIHFVQQMLSRTPQQPIVLYGEEVWKPYNRVRLSGLLSGEYKLSAIELSTEFLQQGNVQRKYGHRVAHIDVKEKFVTDQHGVCQPYNTLVLATGSSAHIPYLSGINLKGVYNYRDLNDVQALAARQARSRKVVVLGGGLLGLEAAKAMQRYHAEVTVLDHMPHLMSRQLDASAAEQLREGILTMGIQVVLRDPVLYIGGEDAVTHLVLSSGKQLQCDTLILATGIRPNIDLARRASIAVARGIKVNDQMQTSCKDVYAIGECAEHNGTVYGIVAPGLEQAAVAAHNIFGKRARFTPSVSATQLKLAGQRVYSLGKFADGISNLERDSQFYVHPELGIYRRLEFRRGRIVGAVIIGDWPQLSRLQEAVVSARRIWPWQKKRFLRNGDLWPDALEASVSLWPATATVCHCIGVSRGQLSKAISKQGCSSVELLRSATGASSVCGSCETLLAQMLNSKDAEETRA